MWTYKDAADFIEFLKSIRKEFAEDRERFMSMEDGTYQKLFEKDAMKRGVQAGKLDYFIHKLEEAEVIIR